MAFSHFGGVEQTVIDVLSSLVVLASHKIADDVLHR